MSLFLLISIGSVCASDSAMDTDIIANDDGGNVTTPTTVVAKDTRINENDPQEISVAVKDNESQTIDIAAGNLSVTENNKTVKFTYNNSIMKFSDKFAVGNHSLIINYLGNQNYNKSSTNIILSIVGNNYTMQTPTSVDVNSTRIIEIPLNITNGVDIRNVKEDDFNATLSYKEGNDTTTINITKMILDYKNGKLALNYPLADDITTSTIALVYTGEGDKLSKNITLNRIFNVKVDVIINETEYKSGAFEFKLTDVDAGAIVNKTVELKYNIKAGSITFVQTANSKTNENGVVSFNNSNMVTNVPYSMGYSVSALDVGIHEVTLSSSGLKLINSTQKVSIKVATIDIKIEDFKEPYATNKNVTITVTNEKTGTPVKYEYLHLNMPQTTGKDYYFMTDANGQSKISVKQLIPAVYNLTVNNNDTQNVNNISVKGNFTIEAAPAKLTVTVASKYYYNSGNVAVVVVTDEDGKRVPNAIILLQVYTGKTSQAFIFQANENGKAYINYAPAAIGEHRLVFSSADSRYTANAVTETVTVLKAKAKITAPKVAAFYKDGKYLTIKLTNAKNNKAIYGAKVNIKVFISSNSYYNYNGQTGLDGQLRISLDTYNPGTYRVVISPGESKNFTASQITTQFTIVKAKAKLVPYALTAKKGQNVNFIVKVKNKKTNNPIAGVKIKIKLYIGKTVKTYIVKTNLAGKAKLNVKSLGVGTYKAIITSKNSYVVAQAASAKIKIK